MYTWKDVGLQFLIEYSCPWRCVLGTFALVAKYFHRFLCRCGDEDDVSDDKIRVYEISLKSLWIMGP